MLRYGENFLNIFTVEISIIDSEEIKDVDEFPVVVCGNQCDLENKRLISTQQGREFAADINAPFFETSGKLINLLYFYFFVLYFTLNTLFCLTLYF